MLSWLRSELSSSQDGSMTALTGINSKISDFGNSGVLTPEHIFTLNVSSVVVGSISLVSTVVAVASFLRMRRSFRHDLILLLILSDMLKTLWLITLPAIELSRGMISSTSNLCQISGFFLSFGIESCDLAVLLMAVHTGLYIFRGRGGLHPYRILAYAIVSALSLMFASLAFVNRPAFVNSGPYCYLPTKPSWTSRLLSWIPRYIVFITIMMTYTCIYVYVRYVMTKADGPSRMRDVGDGRKWDHDLPMPIRSALPSVPPISYHGLIPPTPPSCEGRLRESEWSGNATLTRTMRYGKGKARSILMAHFDGEDQVSVPNTVASVISLTDQDERRLISSHSQGVDDSPAAPGLDRPNYGGQSAPESRPTTSSMHRPRCECLMCSANMSSDVQSRFTIELRPRADSCASKPLPMAILSPMGVPPNGMPEPRHKVRRQLGQLFIYPLVYVAGWIIPFVSHVIGSDSTGRPFGLILASLISLCFQGMADSFVFLFLEKPWRYWKGDSLLCHILSWNKNMAIQGTKTKVGRNREEMLVDGRIARRRREEEQAERQREQATASTQRREWWDAALEGIDGRGYEDSRIADSMRG